MLGRFILLIALAGAGYWYWSGPYQQRSNPDYDKRLEINKNNMRECLRGLNYRAGSTGENLGNPEERCAAKFNLYLYEGQWHSYDDTRPD